MLFILHIFCHCCDEIIGIDFGSTTSCVSHFDKGEVKIIKNELRNSNTPSVASVLGNNIINGELAKQQMNLNNQNTFYAIKKLIGFENNYNFSNFTFNVIRINDQFIIKKYPDNEEYSLDYLASEILKSMKDIAQNYLGKEIHRAVITVPAYFNKNQIDIIRNSSRMAGFTKSKILKEPISSVLAYGLNKNLTKPQKIIVYHLGGYTHDVTLLSIEDSLINILDSQTTDEICGYNFDSRIVDYLLKNFEKKSGKDASNDKNAISKLLFKVEKAKKIFSYVPKTKILINNFFKGQVLYETITREKFEEVNEDLFNKSLNLLKNVLKKTNVTKDEIDGIILSGGSTKLPQIRKIISDFFYDKKIYLDISPEEVVAYGAALEAGAFSGNEESRNIIEINPYSFYIKTDDGQEILMIHENTIVPIVIKKQLNFSKVHQNYFHFEIYVSSNDDGLDLLYLDELNLTNIKPNEHNIFIIDVTFEFDKNFLLKVTAKNEDVAKSIYIDIERERTSGSFIYYTKIVSKKAQEINTIYSIKLNELKELKKQYIDQIEWFTVKKWQSDDYYRNNDSELRKILIDHFEDIFPEIYRIYKRHQWEDDEIWSANYLEF